MTTGAMDENRKMLFEFLHHVTFEDRAGKTLLTIASKVVKTSPGAGKYTFRNADMGTLKGLSGTLSSTAWLWISPRRMTLIMLPDFLARQLAARYWP